MQTSDALGAANVHLGPGAVTFIVLLHKHVGVPLDKIATLLRERFGLTVTPGGLVQALHRAARVATPTYAALCAQIRGSPVVSPDETGWRVGAVLHWLWAYATLDTTVYDIRPGRSFDDAVAVLGADFAGVLVRDGWAPYRRFTNARHQSCLAHLLRRCRTLRADHPRSPWAARVQAVLTAALALRDRRDAALLRGSKTDPQRPLPTDPLTIDSVRHRPTKLSHLIEDVTCEDGLRLLPRPTARSKALPDDQLVPEEGVLHTGLLMVARVLLPLSPSSLLHLSDRAVARGRSWSPSRHGGCPGRWNDDRRATRTRSLVDATRVVGRVRREAGDVAFDLVDQIEGRRRVVNMPAGQGVSDDHARSVDAQMKRLPAAYTASAMFHGRPFTFTHSREPGTVDDEMYACARGEAAKCKVEVLTTP